MPVREKYVESYKEKTTIKTQELLPGIKRDSMLYWSEVYNDTIVQTKIIEPLRLFRFKQELLNSDLQEYTINERTSRLDTLSYLLYGTPYLWWIVKLLNPDVFPTPFSFVEQGTKIYITPFEKVLEVLNKITK